MVIVDWLYRQAPLIGIAGIVIALVGAIGHSLPAETAGLATCALATIGNLWRPTMPGDHLYRQRWVAVWLLACTGIAALGWLVLLVEPGAALR